MRAADVAKIESDRMTDLKKPGVAFWATVVVVGLVGYALTFGRVCWWTAAHKSTGGVKAFEREQ